MSETFPSLDCWLGTDSEGSVLTLLTSLDLNRHWLAFEPETEGRWVPAGVFCLPGAPLRLARAGQGSKEGLA
jgi:hypothetical protein